MVRVFTDLSVSIYITTQLELQAHWGLPTRLFTVSWVVGKSWPHPAASNYRYLFVWTNFSILFILFLKMSSWIEQKLNLNVTQAFEKKCNHWYFIIREQSKKIPKFFFNLLLYLQLNQNCLLQSTPLYCWYTAPSAFSSSGTRPGTCFAGWREGPVANFLLSPLPSEIGDLLRWTSTLGTGKSPLGQNLESRGAGAL